MLKFCSFSKIFEFKYKYSKIFEFMKFKMFCIGNYGSQRKTVSHIFVNFETKNFKTNTNNWPAANNNLKNVLLLNNTSMNTQLDNLQYIITRTVALCTVNVMYHRPKSNISKK